MKSLWRSDTYLDLRRRLARVEADRRPLWGRMNAGQMIAHLDDWMGMAIGENTVRMYRLPLRYPLVKQLAIYCMPVPKSFPTTPELLARQPGEWAKDVVHLIATFERFRARDPKGRWPGHPAFGSMSGRAWGVVAYRHTDHHLRQFAV